VNVEATPSETDQLVGETLTRSAGSGRDWRRAALTFALTTGAIVFFLGAFAAGYDGIHAGKVLPGVHVGPAQVGGLDPQRAEAAIRVALPDPSIGQLTVTLGDNVATISYSQIERDYDMRTMLGLALGVGRQGVIDELRTLANGAIVEPSITWNNDALMAQIQSIADAAEASAVDATVLRDGAHYAATPSAEGRTFDREAAYRAAVAEVSDPSRQSGSVSQAGTSIAPTVSTTQAQAAVDQAENAAQSSLIIAADGRTLTIPADVLRGWVRLVPGANAGEWSLAIESAPIAQYLDDLKLQVDVPATNASYTFKGPGRTAVVPAADGQEIEPEAAVATIIDALQARAAGAAPATVNLAASSVAPEFSTTDAAAIADQIRRLGSWTTHFTVSAFNGGGQNIARPARLINGTVVVPGATFDFIDVAGPFTKRNGYTDGAAIIHGQIKPDGVLGGGLCSASTTLFNAALRAGFQIDERHNHGFYISRYPVGLDATIWENGRTRKSMQFTNDTGYPLLIRGSYSRGRVTFQIYGVDDHRTVAFSKPKVEKVKEAANFVVYTNELGPGKSNHAEFRTDGFDSTVTRTVRDSNGVVIHQDTFFSDYVKVDGIYEVGRYPGDPRAGTRIPASEFVPHAAR
jgi:vancomycin resistance protein YoaR